MLSIEKSKYKLPAATTSFSQCPKKRRFEIYQYDNFKSNKIIESNKENTNKNKNNEKLTYKFSKVFTNKPKTVKSTIVVKHQTDKDLIRQRWSEIHETFLNELLKFDKAVINIIILIKFFEDENSDLLFQQKYFQSNACLVTRDTAAGALSELCNEIVGKTQNFEKLNRILCENFLTKIILNINEVDKNYVCKELEVEIRNHCKECFPALKTTKSAKEKCANSGTTAAKVIKVQHTLRNVQPACLKPIRFFKSIQPHISKAINDAFAKASGKSATLNFALICDYLAYYDFEFMCEIKIFHYQTKISNANEHDNIFFEKLASNFVLQLKNFQVQYKSLVLERMYCLEVSIEQEFAEKIEAPTEQKLYSLLSMKKSVYVAKKRGIPLPKWISISKSCVKITRWDIFSFKWAIIAAVSNFNTFTMPKHFKIYKRIIKAANGMLLNFNDLKFPMEMENFSQFEAYNPDLSIDVFGCDYEVKNIEGPHYHSKRRAKIHINLLCIRKHGDYQFAWIKNISALFAAMRKQPRK